VEVDVRSGGWSSGAASHLNSLSGTGCPLRPVQRLHGHVQAVTCAALQPETAVALTGSRDGTCIVHDAHTGRYLRSLVCGWPVHALCASADATVVLASAEGEMVLFSINGERLRTVPAQRAYYPCPPPFQNAAAACKAPSQPACATAASADDNGGFSDERESNIGGAGGTGGGISGGSYGGFYGGIYGGSGVGVAGLVGLVGLDRFVVVADARVVSVRRSHDLSPLCVCRGQSAAITCITAAELPDGRLEIVAGMHNGRIATWAVDAREA